MCGIVPVISDSPSHNFLFKLNKDNTLKTTLKVNKELLMWQKLSKCHTDYMVSNTQESHVSTAKCHYRCWCMLWQPQHFGAAVHRHVSTCANMLHSFSLVCRCRESIISNQMFCNNYCSWYTSFSCMFDHIAQVFSSH